MSTGWKLTIAIILLLGLGIGLYFYFTAPDSSQNSSNTITIIRKGNPNSQAQNSANFDQQMSSLNQDIIDLPSLVNTPALDEMAQDFNGL